MPSVEHRSLIAVHITSTVFPGRAPAGCVTLSCISNTVRNFHGVVDPDDEFNDVIRDLRQLLGVRGSPVLRKHVHWPHGMPQYDVGSAEVKRAADATELVNPGLYLAGNYRNGCSIGECVESGRQAAGRVAVYLARAG
jgi:oxygen-dependent protoporphyrinogen oxidase